MNYSHMSKPHEALVGASRSSPIVSSSPIFSASLAIALLGERSNAFVYIGTFMVGARLPSDKHV